MGLSSGPTRSPRKAGIRRSIPLIAVAAALLLPASVSATRPNTTIDPCPPKLSLPAFEKFAGSVWEKARWERGAPKAKTIAAARQYLYCSRGSGKRGELKQRWEVLRAEFFDYRELKIAQRERLRYLPYACGGGTRSAISCSIMWCESGGSYTARNPSSTAGGKYQILDSSWVAYGGASYADSHPAAVAPPAEQDRVAAAIWADVGSSAWVCT
jgi:hypothetical protein